MTKTALWTRMLVLSSALAGLAGSCLASTERAKGATEALSPELRAAFISELHRLLPEHFLELDRQLHAQSEQLAHAAKAADGETAAFYAYKLTEACVSCHAQYARHGFPTLSPPDKTHHH